MEMSHQNGMFTAFTPVLTHVGKVNWHPNFLTLKKRFIPKHSSKRSNKWYAVEKCHHPLFLGPGAKNVYFRSI